MADNELMRVVLVEPHSVPRVIEIENSLEAEQEVVKGWIEVSYLNGDDNVCIVSNEEAKLLGMEGNRRTDAGIIAGPFFVVGTTEDSFRGLTDEEVTKYMDKFAEPDDIKPEDVEAEMNAGFRIIF